MGYIVPQFSQMEHLKSKKAGWGLLKPLDFPQTATVLSSGSLQGA
jgi:hypothetical protein